MPLACLGRRCVSSRGECADQESPQRERAGEDVRYDELPGFWSDPVDANVQLFGCRSAAGAVAPRDRNGAKLQPLLSHGERSSGSASMRPRTARGEAVMQLGRAVAHRSRDPAVTSRSLSLSIRSASANRFRRAVTETRARQRRKDYGRHESGRMNYPAGIPAEITPTIASVDLLEKIVGQFADKPAYHNLGHTLALRRWSGCRASCRLLQGCRQGQGRARRIMCRTCCSTVALFGSCRGHDGGDVTPCNRRRAAAQLKTPAPRIVILENFAARCRVLKTRPRGRDHPSRRPAAAETLDRQSLISG